MGRDGQAPKIMARRNRNGVPYVAVVVVLAISLLSYCQVSTSAQVVITYLTGLVGAAQLVACECEVGGVLDVSSPSDTGVWGFRGCHVNYTHQMASRPQGSRYLSLDSALQIVCATLRCLVCADLLSVHDPLPRLHVSDSRCMRRE